MPREVNRYRLNYMQACVKQYDDGSEILQSYTTDVVKKTPKGKYIRLWHSWSPSTSKQVHAYCGRSFRKLPYEDGTYEDLTPVYYRKGNYLEGKEVKLIPAEWERRAKEYAKSITAGLLYIGDDYYGYNTAMHKELKQIYKNNKKYLELFDILNACIRRKPTRSNKIMNTILMLYKYDFLEIWDCGGLKVRYPGLSIHP